MKLMTFLLICVCAAVLMTANAQAPAYDARITEWVNLLPAVPAVGESAAFTAKISGAYRHKRLYAIFRSHAQTMTLPLYDDGAHGDGAVADGVFGCMFPPQKAPGVWYCLAGAGDSSDRLKYSLPQVFQVTARKTEYRALWVDAWNPGLLTPEQARAMVNTARAANMNAIIVQVRKTGDALYRSSIEPRASELKDHAYDPLKTVIDLAPDTSGGKKRLEVHAWVVVYRIYRTGRNGKFPDAPHILGKRPQWASVNDRGEKSDEGSLYLDPGVPEVTDYTIDVCLDIVKKYNVDGINFDYIRYPQGGWGFNPTAIERFRRLNNRTATPARTDTQWRAFLREQVTFFLRKAYVKLTAERPSLKVSVCTIGWGDIRNNDFQTGDPWREGIQDWAEWNKLGILDVNFRMGYKRQSSHAGQFENWSRFTTGHQCFRLSPVGIGLYMNTLSGSLEQIALARRHKAQGLVLYNYDTPSSSKEERAGYFPRLREKAFSQWVDAPPMIWKTASPGGMIYGTCLRKGEPVDGATVTIPALNLSTRTDGTGFYAFPNVPEGRWKISIGGQVRGDIEVVKGSRVPFDDIR